MILLKIAFRNLRQHRSQTLIIGTLIALGVAVLVTGNSIITSVTRGMQASYVDNFTGDLILRNTSEDAVSFIGGFGGAPEPLQNYPAISAALAADPNIEASTPLLTGATSISQNDTTLTFALLWGVTPRTYFKMFPDSFAVTEGERLKDGQEGVMLSQAAVDAALEEGVTLEVGDTVLLSGQNNVTGNKIREVTVRGVGSFKNSAGLLENISFVDVNTLRALTGLTAARTAPGSDAPGAPTDLSEDTLFGGGDALGGAGNAAGSADDGTDVNAYSSPGLDFDDLLGDTTLRDRALALDNDAWHFLLLGVADGASLTTVGQQLEDAPGSETLVVENWRWGAGIVAELAFGLRTVLNIVIAVVAVIIIMNTLVISVTERAAEIGTVRALGGQKNFVRGMITLEALMITLIFGLVGVAFGSAIIGALNLIGLGAPNLFLQIPFGGRFSNPYCRSRRFTCRWSSSPWSGSWPASIRLRLRWASRRCRRCKTNDPHRTNFLLWKG